MSEEEDLQIDLDKLQISPQIPQIKHTMELPILLNPFYDDEINNTSDNNSSTTIQKTGSKIVGAAAKGKCRYRRRSESILDDIKSTTSDTTELSDDNASDTVINDTPGVFRQSLKKTVTIGNRKGLLRPSVLRALQTCLQPQSSTRRQLLTGIKDDNKVSVSLSVQQTNEIMPLKGICNFSDLIKECQTLLLEDVEFSNDLNKLKINKNQQQQQHQPEHNTEKFTCLRTNKRKPNTFGPNNTRIPQIQQQRDEAEITPVTQFPIEEPNSNIITTAFTRYNNTNTITCSQQAGTETTTTTAAAAASSNCDDVTIDELASYFDTLVHIPKKMSPMAEMMYI